MKNMKKYVSPKANVISHNDLDIICTSELMFPMVPLGEFDEDGNVIEDM